MAESEPKRRLVGTFDDKTKLAFDEIKEENIVTEGEDRRLCDLCIARLHEIYRIALYLCFTCCKYFCVECFRNHDTNHNIVRKVREIEIVYARIWNEETEKVGKVREQREIDRAYARIWTEGDIVEPENVCVCDRVNVEHELDEEDKCYITGLCGADNRRWVACDYINSCIKIFQCGSNVLLRYLRIGSKPHDVTEIQVKQDSTVPDSASSSSSDISGTNRTKPDKQCLLAVTLPWERLILFIDINKNPAVTVKSVPMDKRCYAIEYSEDKIFTLCDEDPSLYSPMSVYVMSTNGVKLSVIQTGIYSYRPDLAVLPGRVYLTDYDNKKVYCINVEGRVLSEITMGRLWPYSISVDPDNNVYVGTLYPDYYNIYVGTRSYPDHNVYKLDMDLTGPPRPLLDPSTGYVRRPRSLCCYRDKLFVGHGYSNIVSVVRLV